MLHMPLQIKHLHATLLLDRLLIVQNKMHDFILKPREACLVFDLKVAMTNMLVYSQTCNDDNQKSRFFITQQLE